MKIKRRVLKESVQYKNIVRFNRNMDCTLHSDIYYTLYPIDYDDLVIRYGFDAPKINSYESIAECIPSWASLFKNKLNALLNKIVQKS